VIGAACWASRVEHDMVTVLACVSDNSLSFLNLTCRGNIALALDHDATRIRHGTHCSTVTVLSYESLILIDRLLT